MCFKGSLPTTIRRLVASKKSIGDQVRSLIGLARSQQLGPLPEPDSDVSDCSVSDFSDAASSVESLGTVHWQRFVERPLQIAASLRALGVHESVVSHQLTQSDSD